MNDIPRELTDSQKSAIRWLSTQRTGYLKRSVIIENTGLTDLEYDHLVTFLDHRHCIEIVRIDDGVIASNISINVGILEVLRELDPPPSSKHSTAAINQSAGDCQGEYNALAAQLLGHEPSLAHRPDGSGEHNIGGLTDADDSALSVIVCGLTSGMTARHWETQGEQQRLGWMREAVGRRPVTASVNRPIKKGAVVVLSGGGLRATLFHLGVFVYLAHTNRLKDITGLVSVSGGSIIAAHFAKEWATATAAASGFVAVAGTLVKFARSNVRNKVFVRWLWSRLLLLWGVRRLGRSARLEKVYRRHFGNTTLGHLSPPDCPNIAFVATDSITQERIALTSDRIKRFPLDRRDGTDNPADIIANGIPLSLAVAASSCFPPVFSRMYVTYRELGLNYSECKNTLALNDGGVLGNLGIEVLLELQSRGTFAAEATLISDAERPQTAKPKGTLFTDRDAQAAALSAGARQAVQTRLGPDSYLVRLCDRIPWGLSFRTQTLLARFRTDLDAPSWQEIHALVLHGAAAATEIDGEVSQEAQGKIRNVILEILKAAGCDKTLIHPDEPDLKRSHLRPLGRLLLHGGFISLVVWFAVAIGMYFFGGSKAGSVLDRTDLSLGQFIGKLDAALKEGDAATREFTDQFSKNRWHVNWEARVLRGSSRNQSPPFAIIAPENAISGIRIDMSEMLIFCNLAEGTDWLPFKDDIAIVDGEVSQVLKGKIHLVNCSLLKRPKK